MVFVELDKFPFTKEAVMTGKAMSRIHRWININMAYIWNLARSISGWRLRMFGAVIRGRQRMATTSNLLEASRKPGFAIYCFDRISTISTGYSMSLYETHTLVMFPLVTQYLLRDNANERTPSEAVGILSVFRRQTQTRLNKKKMRITNKENLRNVHATPLQS